MRSIKTIVAALLASALVTPAFAGGEIKLGMGYGELTFGGPSDHANQYTVQLRGEFGPGLMAGLRHTQGEYDVQGFELSYTTLLGAWQFVKNDHVAVHAGLLFEQQEADITSGQKVDDTAPGVTVGVEWTLAPELDASLEAGYLKTNDDDEDILDVSFAVDMGLGGSVSLGIEYWLRQVSADNTADLDQEAISLVLGFGF